MTPKTQTETYAEGHALTNLFGESAKTKIIAALLSESDVDLNVTDIADLAGLHRTTVYDHIDDLEALGVIEQTRTVSGSPMYNINRDSDVTEDIAQLHWDLIGVIMRGDCHTISPNYRK
ncbi:MULTISPECIES: winged helix-turn-helix domain-containing protein [Halobacterium]|uniref:winged helix-turn-helix domain-containing protein n=1 Tax=Halobacterium TaxID=2239 RepID=UPI00073F34EC|nr:MULTISPECIES: winged helix-turn-helix domain-containing protein [Halobacterium]MCG1004899.1 winged helix-turn-helix domain-containing protein [Halobacterium noricense]